MKILKYVGSLFLLTILGCSNVSDQSKQTKSVMTMEVLQVDINQTDTLLNKDGLFLSLDYIGDVKFLASWGKNPIDVLLDTIKILPSGNPQLTKLKDKAIYIQQGCGTACFFGYMLPIKSNAEAKYYLYPLATDLENDLIVYNGEETEYLAIVENYLTGQKQFIMANFLSGPFPGHSIDSIAFQSNWNLYIQWKDSSGKYQKKAFELSPQLASL